MSAIGNSAYGRRRASTSRRGRKATRNRLKKRRLILERLEDRIVLAQILWDGGGGDMLWSNPLNWSNDQLPASDDAVVIAATGTVVHDVGATQIRSLDLRSSLNLSGGTVLAIPAG